MGYLIFVLLIVGLIYLLVKPALDARAAARREDDAESAGASRHEILRLEDYPRRPRRRDDTIDDQQS